MKQDLKKDLSDLNWPILLHILIRIKIHRMQHFIAQIGAAIMEFLLDKRAEIYINRNAHWL